MTAILSNFAAREPLAAQRRRKPYIYIQNGIMETRKRSKEEWARRYAAFVVILFVIAFGTSLSIRANLGSSPISAPPYVLSLVPGVGLTMGQLTILMHVFFIAAQVALLRRGFERRQWLQIAVSFLFGFYTDLTMWLTGFLQVPQDMAPAIGLPLRLAELLLGGAVLAFGIAMEVRCDSLMLAGEGFPLAIAKFTGRDFGKVKICTDTLLVCIGAAFMLINFGRWDWAMVGPGTLISMFYVGMMVRVIAPHIAWLDRLLIPKAGHAQAAAPDRWGGHRVVAIARTYGSGGNDVALAVAQRLGWPCYDRQLIDLTAQRLGYSPQLVERSEQNIPTARLWELVMEDSGIPASMNPSRDDAIFVSQSRTIRELAHGGDCVIVGRLAGWTLRDDPHVLRVFVTSGRESAARRVADRLGISVEEAARKQARVDTGRANHCRRYTGQQWASPSAYDLTLNTDRLGIDGAADMIVQAAMAMGKG